MGIVEQLEWAIDIVDLVQKYSKIKKAWVNYKGLCPFPGHNEKTPSFMVSPAKQIAYCFWCHKWWGPVKFVMDIENTEFKDAIEVLWNLTGIAVNTNFDKEKYKAQKNLYSLYKDAANYYKSSLSKHPEIKKYLMERGFNEESITNFHLWYSNSWLELYNYLREKWYDDKIIEESKIFLDIRTKKDKFINRVIFPIQNARWDFVAFTWRVLWVWEPKYLNSPASDIYDKSAILYGLYTAKNQITKSDFVIVTEWNPDTIAMQQYGFFNTVAVSGTALTEKHLVILKRLTHKVYLCFDNDKAWEKATKSSLEMLKNKDLEVKVISLQWGKDPDEILTSWGDFQILIDKAESPIWYYIAKAKFDVTSIEEKRKLLKELLDIVKSYSDNIEKDFYLKEISRLLDINTKIVYDLFNRVKFTTEKKWDWEKNNKALTSEELAIWNILIDEKHSAFFKKHIVFTDWLHPDLLKALEKWPHFINDISLDQKERYRGISLQIEEENKLKTENNSEIELEKLTLGINRDMYKKMVNDLKNKMKKWDTNAFTKYSEIAKIAKDLWIK